MDLRLSQLRSEARKFRKNSPRLFIRILSLIKLAKRRAKYVHLGDLDYEIVGSKFDVTGRTIRRWEKAYKQGGVKTLTAIKNLGKKAKSIRGWTAKLIVQWREDYKWGAEVIQAHLLYNHNIKIGRFRIERFLKRKGFIEVKRSYKKKKTHTRIVQVETPGAHTQTDVKYQTKLLSNNQKCYVYNFVDHASRWEHKKAFDSYGAHETKTFITEVIKLCPFKIFRLQSDNGVEFTNKYISNADDPVPHALDILCIVEGIRHVLIPPGEKELQGLVERSHRTDDEELYHRIKPQNLKEFNELLKDHCEFRNTKRRKSPLGWKTTAEWLANYEKQKLAVQENQTFTEEERKQLDELKKAA